MSIAYDIWFVTIYSFFYMPIYLLAYFGAGVYASVYFHTQYQYDDDNNNNHERIWLKNSERDGMDIGTV